MLEFEEARRNYPDATSEGAGIVGEISQLINDCEGLEPLEWDRLITMLEEEHKVYKSIDYDADAFKDMPLPDDNNVAEDWEVVV